MDFNSSRRKPNCAARSRNTGLQFVHRLTENLSVEDLYIYFLIMSDLFATCTCCCQIKNAPTWRCPNKACCFKTVTRKHMSDTGVLLSSFSGRCSLAVSVWILSALHKHECSGFYRHHWGGSGITYNSLINNQLCLLLFYIVLSIILFGQTISDQVLMSSGLCNGPILNRSLFPVEVHYEGYNVMASILGQVHYLSGRAIVTA